ncbi:Long-chain-fatty-acid--CoA ligase [Thalassoglobus neptunius]|uniref:Long-chain-fatty-acid--CoA ligase n=1 Tax=Thalassoglobus neptunius TaxID=1938619 RepID=A0A5C5WWD2_9PLAN|nr:fatty acid CoA ligase family protein [Thalassoglobus neptunius]TWT55274.1 Long-chain-fatty-acid--CoA ligase [Thalassoglobus neptunius]
MPSTHDSTGAPSGTDGSANIAARLTERAKLFPDQLAVAEPVRVHENGEIIDRRVTLAELDERSDRIAAGLIERGFQPGMKLVLFVPFGIDFITLTFALFKAGAVIVLIDPGMGRTNIFRCLEEVQPDGFVAVPIVHLVRMLNLRRFQNAKFNILSRLWLPGMKGTLKSLSRTSREGFTPHQSAPTDLAAVIFTSGSTGPPKGVAYEHGMFDAQVKLIQEFYQIQPQEVDLPGFPLFGLFNAAMGVTTIIPDMDPTKPATVDPTKIVAAIRQYGVTQAFGSPAFWNRVARFCVEHEETFPSLNRALSAGGPVPLHVLERMRKVLTKADADLHTPYGATESLPVASIGARTVLETTAEATRKGAGTCVGTTFPSVDVRIIKIHDGPLESIDAATILPENEIGEIIVRSPSVTREYFQRPDATRLAKIADGDRFWHRIGDVGYLDSEQRLWFCGRKAHIVVHQGQRMFSVCCEAIFNQHSGVYRSALVGLGNAPNQKPVLVVEPEAGQFPESGEEQERMRRELLELGAASSLTQEIKDILFHRSLPVDTRHNVKIQREALAQWASTQVSSTRD